MLFIAFIFILSGSLLEGDGFRCAAENVKARIIAKGVFCIQAAGRKRLPENLSPLLCGPFPYEDKAMQVSRRGLGKALSVSQDGCNAKYSRLK